MKIIAKDKEKITVELATGILHLVSLHHDCELMNRIDQWGNRCPACRAGTGQDIIEELNKIIDPDYNLGEK